MLLFLCLGFVVHRCFVFAVFFFFKWLNFVHCNKKTRVWRLLFLWRKKWGVRAITKEYESKQKAIVPKRRKYNLQKYILIPFSTLTIKSWVEREWLRIKTTYFNHIFYAEYPAQPFFIIAHIKEKNMEIIMGCFSTEMHDDKDGKTTFRQVGSLGKKTVIRGRSLV